MSLRYAVNCSLLFTEVPLLERPRAAADAGFSAVEFWWPWPDQPVPADQDVDAFVRAVRDAGVQLIGLNFWAADLTGPDCGVVSLPGREQDFRDNVAVVASIGAQLDVPAFNALYGNRLEGVDAAEQDAVATDNLRYAAKTVGTDRTVLLEMVSGPKPYPLRTAADVAGVLDRVGEPNVRMLFDIFHLAGNGDDVSTAIDTYADRIAHVQVADLPGRHEPGTGELPIAEHLAHLERAGYDGRVALEYLPATNTTDSLTWLPREARG